MPEDWIGSAQYSPDKKHRYVLYRDFFKWTINESCVFIMLNPSVATEFISDPTVRRCEGFCRLWGYRRLVVLNIFALRSTDPKKLYTDPDPVGELNNIYLQNSSKGAGVIVCAWGVHGKHLNRGQEVLRMLVHKKPCYLKLTKEGIPSHPLYLKADLKPIPYLV
jgi:hypothetical protein